jgi:hypothetical protein
VPMNLHSPKPQGDVCAKKHMLQLYISSVSGVSKVCYKVFCIDVANVIGMLHMLQQLYTYVSSVDTKCFICFRRILKVFHLDVAYICKCYRCFHTYVASVFILMFAMATHVVLSFHDVFASVPDVCCKCFNYFRTYVASISFRCSKSRSDIAHVVVEATYRNRLLQLIGSHACVCE